MRLLKRVWLAIVMSCYDRMMLCVEMLFGWEYEVDWRFGVLQSCRHCLGLAFGAGEWDIYGYYGQ